MITAYFDASYNHPEPGSSEILIYTVACYFGADDNWDKFRREWRRELAKKGVPDFHMNRFEWARSQAIGERELPKSNPYYGWPKDDFDSFLDRLHQIINRKAQSGLYRLACRVTEVIKQDFDESMPMDLKEDPQCRSCYIFSVVNIMEAIALWANQNTYYDPIRYVFADGDREGANLDRWFAHCWKDPILRQHFRVSKGHSRKFYDVQGAANEPAVQAADTAAYEFNKAVIRWVEKECQDMPKSDLRRSLTSLARSDHYGWLFRKRELIETYASMRAWKAWRAIQPI